MRPDEQPPTPSRQWRAASIFTMGAVGVLCRGFLFGLSNTEVYGMREFLELLDERENVEGRRRGLITVSNHVSVMDDPLVWGVLPLRYLGNPDNMRWGLGSYDLCFQNRALSTFFSLGQVLPTHRSAHSEFGGLFQPTITQAIRLLSRGPFVHPNDRPARLDNPRPDCSDPFSSGQLTYSTNGRDTFPAPAAYLNRRHSWIHIFPEGKVHQKEDRTMRYFKWGVSRLILESDPCPDIVPMWIEGPEEIMHETRTFPRFIPRPFKNVSITFGEKLDSEKVFGDLRARWKRMRAKAEARGSLEVGVLNDALRYSDEAVKIRKECTMRIRAAVLAVRRTRGLPDEDPKVGLAETYAMEGNRGEGRKADGSMVKET
ncbi:uncharacterized protein BDR25DRAFT_249267 [Lindgomyces ingoldianus]|uniref:Uncharacterized protein n=1 Tax=Lindgomyces ingoldianus TaxID=673940 RepID=A0ACB6RDY6_9PLEO|nr:uncharacterized protein BDR25DRAFT_249267 [Lindgomyces ingoldianus]KAF2477356.1 hypothetical protein BDR25DRAFT_249267 [Lindgomyces ingoldianus]